MEPSHGVGEVISRKVAEGLFSYRALGEKLGVSHAYLNNIVKGRQRPPKSGEFYIRLADALNIDVRDISEFRAAILKERIESDPEFLDAAWEKLASDIGLSENELAVGLGGKGGLRIHLDKYSVEIDGAPLSLSFKEFELLRVMASEVDRVFTRDILLETVWGYDYYGGTRTVDVHITRLRAKLGSQAMLIQTVHNVGYRFVGPVEII